MHQKFSCKSGKGALVGRDRPKKLTNKRLLKTGGYQNHHFFPLLSNAFAKHSDLPQSQQPSSQDLSPKKKAILVIGVESANVLALRLPLLSLCQPSTLRKRKNLLVITLGTSVEDRTSFICTSQLHISVSHLGVGALRACGGGHGPSLAVFGRQDLDL